MFTITQSFSVLEFVRKIIVDELAKQVNTMHNVNIQSLANLYRRCAIERNGTERRWGTSGELYIYK